LTSVSEFKGWSYQHKVLGRTLDRLCDDQLFYVERGEGWVPSCGDSACFTTLSPVELIELGTELIQERTTAIKA
jgi:hypothetical protein